jgi:hypothetical protein
MARTDDSGSSSDKTRVDTAGANKIPLFSKIPGQRTLTADRREPGHRYLEHGSEQTPTDT